MRREGLITPCLPRYLFDLDHYHIFRAPPGLEDFDRDLYNEVLAAQEALARNKARRGKRLADESNKQEEPDDGIEGDDGGNDNLFTGERGSAQGHAEC